MLNTHLMGVLSMAEASIRGICGWCLGEARAKAVAKLASLYRRRNGYLSYSKYSREHMGEDDKYPPYRGYSLLSSRLAMKAGIYLNDEELYRLGKDACIMGYRRIIDSSWRGFEGAARCLSIIQFKEGNVLDKLANVLELASSRGVLINVKAYDVETAVRSLYQPAAVTRGNVQLAYIGPVEN